MDTGGISCCFDRESQRMYDDYKKKGLGETSVIIADAMAANGLQGSTVLEVGCGFGSLAIELVRRGASRAVGEDLSPKMIETAKRLAAENGLSESVSFRLGDGAVSQLPPSKMVVLDAVLCCYPDLTALVENTSSAAQSLYAFAVPDDTRFVTRLMRVFLPLQGLFLGRKGFRFYIHPTRRIQEMLEARGLGLVSRSPAGWIWSVFVFRRA